MASLQEISLAIKNEALRIGFDACGFSKAEALVEDRERLSTWLNEGLHASMKYMENHFEKRTDPRELVPGAKTVISLIMNYYSPQKQHDPEAPVISKYAYGTDYHFVMKDRMWKLFNWIDSQFGTVKGRVFVDSAPILDRAWARKAGLGWIGKNSNLIHRDLGSFFFIGEIILDLEMEYNSIPESDFCGACTACIEACPTNAILDNRTIDSKRCISYQTIENKGAIPEDLRGKFEHRVFGCDICQDVCPWNRKAKAHNVDEFMPNKRLLEMSKTDWTDMTEPEFDLLFSNSALQRTGYTGMRRNLNFLYPDSGK